MDWAWTSSLDQIWRSASFPMWVTLAAAGFFAILMLITLLRAEKSVANGALTVITLLAVGVAVAATIRSFGLPGSPTSATSQAPSPAMAAAPALACIDDLAGETVLTACEKTLFGSAETTAAAISYAASQITRLTSLGDAATVTRNLTPEVESLRRSIERDRYGLMAYVLVARDHCSPQACPAFRALGNSRQIMTNMDDRVYEGLVMRYSASWGAPAAPSIAAMPPGVVAALPPVAGVPTGKPTTMIDFPSASSTPPVSIMTPEPGAPGSAAPARPATPARPAAAAAAPNAPAAPAAPPPAAKKQAPKAARAPTQLAPPPGSQAPSSPPPAPASATDND
ncbi:MAG: hypothetical protein GY844_19100 [Bradyrhizobium sp.]|nr:hypothetical protein [Bradyrhizobium sp.]